MKAASASLGSSGLMLILMLFDGFMYAFMPGTVLLNLIGLPSNILSLAWSGGIDDDDDAAIRMYCPSIPDRVRSRSRINK